MKFFDLSVKLDEKVLFFSIDPQKYFTHFHFRGKTYTLTNENVQRLPKTFSCILFSASETIIDEAIDQDVLIDAYGGEVVYIRYDSQALEWLENFLIRNSKYPDFYPSLALLRRVNDGAYVEVYYLEESEKYFLTTYIIEERDFKTRSFQIFPQGSEAELIAEIVNNFSLISPETTIYVYSEVDQDDLVNELEERFRSSVRLVEIKKLSKPAWTFVSKKNLPKAKATETEISKARFRNLLIFSLSLIIFFLTSFFEYTRYLSLQEKISERENEIRRLRFEIEQTNRELRNLAPLLAYALPKKYQPDWKRFLLDVAELVPHSSRLKTLKIKKDLYSLRWTYELIFEVFDVEDFEKSLAIKKLKIETFRRARGNFFLSNDKFYYRLKGEIRINI